MSDFEVVPTGTDAAQITHSKGCWAWGPRHHACALAEIRRLQGDLDLTIKILADNIEEEAAALARA